MTHKTVVRFCRGTLSFAVATVFVGCTGKLISEPVGPKAILKPSSGIEYQLLRQDFLIQAQWTLTKCEKRADEKIEDAIVTDFKAVLRPERRADPNHIYRVAIEKLATGAKDVELGMEFYDSAELGGPVIKAMNISAKDKTAEIIKGAIEIAGSVARLVVGVPVSLPLPMCKTKIMEALKQKSILQIEIAKLKHENQVIDKQLSQLSTISQLGDGNMKDVQNAIKSLLDNKQEIMKEIKYKGKILGETLASLRLTVTAKLHPDWEKDEKFTNSLSFDVLDKAKLNWFLSNPQQGIILAEKVTAELRLRFVGSEPIRVTIPNGPIDGLILRQPKDADIFVCRNKCEPQKLDALILAARANEVRLGLEKNELKRLEQEMQLSYRGRFGIPQAGRPIVVPLHNGPFQENGIELVRDAQGRIRKIGYKTNAAIAAGVAALAGNAKQVEGTVGTLSNADLLRKKQELDRLTTEEGLLIKQKSINALRQELQVQ